MKRGILIVILFIVVAVFQEVDAQCAMCKLNATTSSDMGDQGSNGLNNGILYLMGIPYVLLLFFFRNHIKNLFSEIIALYRK